MSKTIEVKLLGKDYRVACEPAERDALLTMTAERQAEEAARLNLAHEFLALKNTPADVAATLESESIQRRIDFIEAKLDESLAQHSQLF